MVRKRNWRNTVGAKTMATVLSAAMAFSGISAGMPGSTAFAEEDPELLELDEEVIDLTSEDDSETDLEFLDEDAVTDASTEETTEDTTPDDTSDEKNEAASRSFDESKTDVWDLGAENLGEAYNNRLDVDTINGFYSAAPGTKGVNLASFSVDDGDFVFEDGGYSTTHRLRTTNLELTHYDEKSLTDSEGNVYSGYIYSNKSSTDAVYVALECQADDIITAYVSSNGTDSQIHFKNMTDATDDSVFGYVGGSGASKAVFYPSQTAKYKIYSATEKLCVARVYREHAKYATLTGTVEGFKGVGSFDLVFTNTKNGNVVKATVADGKFTAKLAEGFDYEVSLAGADEYVIKSDKTVNLSADAEMNVVVEGITLVTASGKVTGIEDKDAADFMAAAEFKFVPQDETSVYVPQIQLATGTDGITYEVKLQKDVKYDVLVADKEDTVTESYAAVEDYDLITKEVSVSKDSEDLAIEFQHKPLYNVTILPKGATAEDLAEAVFTFTRLNVENDFVADGYVYKFTGTKDIALRDGQYVVEVSNAGAFVQKLTSDLVVKGADVTKEIGFASDITVWDFSDAAFTAKFANAVEGNYNGLSWTNGRSHNGVYLYSGAGKISVPVKGACQIKVTANYQYSFYFENENEPSVNQKTGSTSQNDTFTYDYNGGAGTVDITVMGQSYITKIETVYQTEYRAELLVGSSEKAEFATINEALAAVRLMNRKDGERVTIKVEPGNYEEMLVVDVPNVTLENASATPTNTLKNKGVDIDENAVRVTWYYGHGYTYYSMNNSYKYDEEVLATNKANGYTTVINPGSGTATYWNASVVIDAAGFEARNIIFENSFNQYMSQKATEDVIVPQSSVKEGAVARNTMAAGDTKVQDKKYVERAAALALTGSATEAYFEGCRIIGRQDTLYGHEKTTAAFYNCAVYGGTDYIFGAMTAVFAKCDLVLNTSEDKNDVAYITAPQQKSNSTRGYLMYNCTVKSTTPGVDTASAYTSKPGQFGRPWQANTSEVVFFDTVVEATSWKDGAYDETAKTSLIQPVGWNTTLGGESARNVEYGTFEVSGENNSAARAAWVQQPKEAVLADGKAITVAAFLGDWDPFTANNADMKIVFPDGSSQEEPVVEEPEEPTPAEPSETTEFVLESSALTAFAANEANDGKSEKAGTEDYFTLFYSAKSKIDATSAKKWEDGYEAAQRINFGGKPTIVDGQAKNAVKFTTSNAADVKIWWVANKDTYQMALLNSEGQKLAATNVTTTSNLPYFSTFRVDEAGTYYLGGDEVNNYIFKIVVTEDKVAAPVAYDLESKNLTAFAANEANDGKSEKAGTEDYFTLYYSAKSKIDATSAKTWEDGYEAAQRINFGGKPTIVDGQAKNAIGFTTSGEADVKIWWVANKDAYQMALLNSEGQKLAATDVATTSNKPYFSTFKIENAGTYYIGGDEVNNYIFKVEVTEGSEPEEIKRAEWESVAAPAITNVTLDETNANNVVVNVTSEIGVDGGDRLDVTMFDSEGKEVKTLGSTAAKTEFTFTFSPAKSGKYTFSATLSREDEETVKTSAVSDAFEFVLPLVTPEFKNVVNQGKGNVKVNFYSVPEATGYVLTATDKTDSKKKPVEKKFTLTNADANDSTEYTHVFKGLTAGHTYEISLVAVRGEETTKANTFEVNVTKEAETEWVFSAFGTGVTKGSNAGFTANENGSVTVWNTGNKGKLVPASTDGLAFYYTAVPANKNFTLTAKATIDTWTFTNGQEGFGLMAADRVGVNGNAATFWNNSYMATATKVEYYYDRANHAVTNVDTADKISMKLGLGSQEKIGVTPSNLERLEANDSAAVKEFFSSKMTPLETSCGDMGPGTYNLFAKEASGSVKGTVENPLTEVTLRIQKNNTGYFVSYLDNEGNVLKTVKYYDTKALNKLDSKYVYVGFFAARTFKVTFSDIELKVIDPSKDAKAEPKEPTYVEPSYKVISPEYSNTAKYELSYSGNADGVLTITDETGYAVVDRQKVKAGAVKKVNVRLEKGDNKFTVTFTPNKNFNPGGDKYQKLSNYDTFTFEHNVKYQTVNDSDKIFVDPNGDAKAEGTAEAPVDIYTALKFVQAGQTIVLTPGTYNLKSGLVIEKGIDGTAAEPITMVAEGGRAVLDFGGRNTDKGGAGFVIAGNYWNIKGIDVTKTGNGDKGILLAGSHNTLEDIRTYENGNTGIQVSRYLKYEWPSYDLILNCTSFSNADAGYEDADGFAAKLTCGEGIVFDGCISYNNADDGWDLFAKVENGSIGQVTIQNCVAFANGYGVDGKNEGNGNGFKMGGESMPGAHKLINSVAWGNKAKGIDSNSGPDIQVYNCMSFNNGANNVALYANDAANTNYLVNGVISYRTTGKETNENFKLRGTQDESRVYGKNNFFWMDGASKNADGVTITDDWFVFDKNNKIDALAAPKADVNDPYAVAAAMRTEDGRIDLGNFLKLSETGIKALEAAGVDTAVAALDGAYTAVADERQIEGSANDAAQSVPGFELENFSTKISYTGKKLTQDFSVYYDGKLLAEGVDYSVAYKNNVNVGTAVVTISGKGIYKGKTVETFRIVPADIAEAAVAVKAVNETGKEANKKYPKVTATVVYMGKTLKAGKDYQVVVNWDEEPKTTTVKDAKGNDITVKHYPVSITGLGNFDGEYKNADVLVFGKGQKIVKTALDLFNIKSESLELATTAYVYDGTAKTPEVTVYTGKGAKKGEKLDASRYTVKYSGNINKGTATVTVTGIESQKTTGTLTARFTIAAADISAATVAPIEPVEYVKGGVKPAPVVKLGENTLREGVDYKLTYAGTNKIGLTGKKAPNVTITGLKNFKGSVVKTFEITTKGIDKATVITTDKAIKKNAKGKYLVSKPVVYDENGKALKEKTDYTLKFFYGESEITSKTVLTEGNNEVKVVVTGKGAYTGETSATYQIRTLNKLSQVKSAKISAQKYTGSAVRPDDKIRLYTETRTGKTVATKNLVRGTDYEIALCYNNVKQGTATYVLRGMGEYTGYKTVTFKITKAATK
ncbi:pectinesterase family protein [Butyrivibrio sp. AE3009]|uniref:pectinesterase family protein n=1 Tax=Butyrivibrio sp. AE3009 TaxID=1280666 RepID=UPI0003B3E248|nr:pectinesterase family protein [Butyrivibrio sp. AE3009]